MLYVIPCQTEKKMEFFFNKTYGSVWHFLLFLCFQLIYSLPSSFDSTHNNHPHHLCPPTESFALLQFKNSFPNIENFFGNCDGYGGVSSSYPKTESWVNATDCCSWDGVTCDAVTGNVIGLDLSCSWLYGKLPSNNSLPLLSHLHTLNLACNDFLGSPIPPVFGQFVSLTHLNLSYSMFSGIVPSEISHLSKLLSLDLSGNNYLGVSRDNFESLSKNLTQLGYLSLDFSDMSSVVPTSLLNLSDSLVSLGLDDCSLHGTFPDKIFHFPLLKELFLSWNEDLSGTLPKSNWSAPLKSLGLSFTNFYRELPNSFGNLKHSLKELFLDGCTFTGLVPNSLWNLTQLKWLDISDNNFIGQIPATLSNFEQSLFLSFSNNHFEGPIPDIFGNFTKLTMLSFDRNNFSDQLPLSIFNISELEHLDLSYNKLTGPLTNIGNLPKLTELKLHRNKLNGQLPSSIFNISKLEHLSLFNNQLTGPLPNIVNLPELTDLFLHSNKLSGKFPEFHCKSLEYLKLDGNMMHGSIPTSIFHLVNLRHLILSSNNLSGIIELDAFSKIENLEALDLSDNNLSIVTSSGVNSTWPMIEILRLRSCRISAFPDFLRKQKVLQDLDLSNNNLRGTVPKWMSSVGNETYRGSLRLDLSHNLLTSVKWIPWMNLYNLDLHSNMLQGSLPIIPTNVNFLPISNNNLSGDVPSSICQAYSLEVLDLSYNNLSGVIPPCLGNVSRNMAMLDLRMNNFHGTIPETFAEECNLRNLNLQGNHLEGSLPQSLVKCKELEVLDLGNNKLRDTFPKWLETFQNIQVVIFQFNKFHGVLPDLKVDASFSKLLVLDLSHNNFHGLLPSRYLKSFKLMMNVDSQKRSGSMYLRSDYSPYYYSVTLTLKGNEIVMQKIFHTFTSMDLSSNNFEREIAEDIGNLHALRGLNLSHNCFSGAIPPSIGNLTQLEGLDLSSNKLAGEIPVQLTDLTALETLDLSHNQLVGSIPKGKQFNTFTNDSYVGNLGLCGFPLSKQCDQAPSPSTSEEDQDNSWLGFGWKVVAIGYACGMIIGVAIGCIVFRTGRPQWLLVMIEGKGYRRRTNPRRHHATAD